MKKLLCLAGLVSSLTTLGQDCKNYYFLQNNKTVEMTITNKKGDVTGKQVYTISGVGSSGGTTSGTVNSEMFDKKGKSIAKASGTMKCSGGVFMIDMKMMLPAQQQ
ncbi:MAG TPA: hypothetical protein VLD19_19975, partial [Chitinophagaceae bacterium]|nr:hypothetical protein [Chitinophagaceae bacterium]